MAVFDRTIDNQISNGPVRDNLNKKSKNDKNVRAGGKTRGAGRQDTDFDGPAEPDFGDPFGVSDAEIRDLLKEMGGGKHSPTLYRDAILEQLTSVLISESMPNALLVGPAGCGKTKIAEELAYRIAARDVSVPEQLYGYKVCSLQISDIVAGSGLVGQLESKVESLIEYLSAPSNRVILFIDEVHMLFSGETYKKVAQILKPALSRGRIRTVAATTTQEVKLIDADPAFNRRFTRVLVDELTKEQTGDILLACRGKLAKHYGVTLSMDARMAELIVNIADESCSAGSHRPDNAMTLLDRAVALAIVMGQRRIVRLDADQVELTARRMTSGNSSIKRFSERAFRDAMAEIRGQEHIVDDLTRVLKLHDMHIRPRRKPLTFMFAGASGVGKTAMAKIIADSYVCEKPIVLNMAEYHSPASINRLIGAPAGYIGFDQNHELPFDPLDSNPYQVILLDEFEKCDRAVQRLFMSVFDEGVMKTNFGKDIDFSKAIVIATTNAGCTEKRALGFGSGGDRRLSVNDLADHFDVELLNRFGHIYTFHDISKNVYRDILQRTYMAELAGIVARGEVDGVFAPRLSEEELQRLADASYEAKLGARPALTVVTEYIDDKLLEYLEGGDREKAGPALRLAENRAS